MKVSRLNFTLSIFLFASAIIALPVNASPIQYQVSGTISQYEGSLVAPYSLTPDQYPIPMDTTFNGTFFYDSSKSTFTTFGGAVEALNALSNLSVKFGSYTIADSGDNVWVYNKNHTNLTFSDPNGNLATMANGLRLSSISFDIYTYNPSFPQLPSDLTTSYVNTRFYFWDPKLSSSSFVFSGTAVINQLPVPQSAYLFLSGLIGLMGSRRYRK